MDLHNTGCRCIYLTIFSHILMVSSTDTIDKRLAIQVLASRKLGYIETVMALLHQELRGTTQIAHLLHLRGHIDYEQLRQAANILFEQFTVLRCAIREIAGTFFFEETLTFDKIPIRQVGVLDSDAAQALFDKETDSALEQTESLWRLTLIRTFSKNDSRLVIVSHHAMADWFGVEVLFTKLLAILDKIMAGEPVETLQYDLHPPVDVYLRHPALLLNTPALRSQIKYAQPAPLTGRKTRSHEIRFDAVQLERLRLRCAQKDIKVHSLLSAALCLSAYSLGLADSPLPIRTAVSLRTFGDLRKSPEHDLSCYISVADTAIDILTDDIWLVAKDYQKKLFSFTKKYCLYQKQVDLSMLKSFVSSIEASEVFFQGFAITNIGDVVLPEYRHFTIEDYTSRINRLAGNFAAALQVDIYKQNLRINFIYTEPLWNQATIMMLSQLFAERLMDA